MEQENVFSIVSIGSVFSIVSALYSKTSWASRVLQRMYSVLVHVDRLQRTRSLSRSFYVKWTIENTFSFQVLCR